MAEFDIDVHELEDYAKVVRTAARRGASAFTSISRKYQLLTMNEAKRLAPWDPSRKSGLHLRETIQPSRVSQSHGSLSAEWEVTAPHAAPVEYGFVHYRSGEFIGPQSYVRPALKRFREGYVEELGKAAGLLLQASKNPQRVGVTLRGNR